MSSHPKSNSNSQELAKLLTDVATGRISAAEALQRVSKLAPPMPSAGLSAAGLSAAAQGETEDVAMSPDRVTLDLDRQRRCGFPEVIYGEGKPAEMIAAIIQKQRDAGQASFATRITADIADSVQAMIPDIRFNPVARTLTAGNDAVPETVPTPLPHRAEGGRGAATVGQHSADPHVAVVTAGSTDAPVAEEAIETLHWMGIRYRNFDDIGVAGPARLLAAVPQLREAAAVIVIAGMEGALPAAVGGHLSVPVFAVPTSVGYGATLGGLTPLMGMLSSCASNVAVVNIDAGFKAAYLAGLVVRPLLNQP